jgi:hypothetical protein
MKHAALVAALVLAGASPALAAPAPVMTYAVIDAGKAPIMLSTTGGCGVYQRPMKAAQQLHATCSANDGKSTIAATSYPAKKMLCAAHITRQGGIDYMTFTGSTLCHASETLHHIDIVITSPPPIARR